MSGDDSDSWSIISEEYSDDELNTSETEGFTKVETEHNNTNNTPTPKPAKKELAPKALVPDKPTRQHQGLPIQLSKGINDSSRQSLPAPKAVSKIAKADIAVPEVSKEDSQAESLKRKYEYTDVTKLDPSQQMYTQRSIPPRFIKEKTVCRRARQMNHSDSTVRTVQAAKESPTMAPAPRETIDAVLHKASLAGQASNRHGTNITRNISSMTKGLEQIRLDDLSRDWREGLVPQVSGTIDTQTFTFWGPATEYQPPNQMTANDFLSQIPKVVGPSGQATAPPRSIPIQLGSTQTQTQPSPIPTQVPIVPIQVRPIPSQPPQNSFDNPTNVPVSGNRQPHPDREYDGLHPSLLSYLPQFKNSSATENQPIVRPGPFRPQIANTTDPLKSSDSRHP
ncbi:hypothetical protein IFR04_013530 [Cadophora malorum]|uniref:Uncharacterized protein n=1 Tax=Cadophora malorum TaxID=108018 RepID=A0A8H7T6H1_9HELO|nr:hypothetical protein IFR04_013530 [Cadophora malorum]